MGYCLIYHIVLKKWAKKFLDKLSFDERIKIVKEIEKLPTGNDIKPLRGHDGLLRLRVGKYRIIYSIDNGRWVVIIIDIDSLGQIYKRL